MNERVIKLYKQATEFAYKTAGADAGKGTIIESLTAGKFAELIVRECAGIALKDATPEWDWTEANTQSKKIAVDIKQHFGLKE